MRVKNQKYDSPFAQYKHEYVRYMDKNNKDYQSSLRRKNKEMSQRFKQHEEERAYKKRMKTAQRKMQQNEQESAECNFKPKLNPKTKEISRTRREYIVPDEFSPKGSRVKRFYDQEMAFVKKRENKIELANKESKREITKMHNKKFISQASEKVFQNRMQKKSSRGLSIGGSDFSNNEVQMFSGAPINDPF